MNLYDVREKIESARKRVESPDVSARGLRNALNDVLDAFEQLLEQLQQELDPVPDCPDSRSPLEPPR